MRFTHNGKEHDVGLLDDGPEETIILVDGSPHTYTSMYVNRYRNLNGMLSELGLLELAQEVLAFQEKG